MPCEPVTGLVAVGASFLGALFGFGVANSGSSDGSENSENDEPLSDDAQRNLDQQCESLMDSISRDS
jgi:hypothetical protein